MACQYKKWMAVLLVKLATIYLTNVGHFQFNAYTQIPFGHRLFYSLLLLLFHYYYHIDLAALFQLNLEAQCQWLNSP